MPEVDKFIPNLRGLIDPHAEQQIHDAFVKVYEFFERKLVLAQEENKKLLVQQVNNFQKTSDLVNGIFATPLIGGTGQINPLQTIGVGNGTVKRIIAGGGLSGGTITEDGTIALIIGTANIVQKSNGTESVDTRINEDGNSCSLDSAAGFEFATDISRSRMGDWNGNNNGTYIEIDDVNMLIKLTNLPIVDPGVSGALWNNSGVISISP